MAINYLHIISEFFPAALVKLSVQDPTSYNNIVWDSTPIPKSTLDLYANRGSRDVMTLCGDKVTDGGVLAPIINDTLYTIPAGFPVYSMGTDTLTGRPIVAKSDSSIAETLPAIGIAVNDIAANSVGLVCIQGVLYDAVNTATFNAGDSLYVAVGGGLTNIRPNESQWQKVATVREVGLAGDVVVNMQSPGTRYTQRSIDINIYGTANQCYRSITTTSYSTVARFVYRGTSIYGPPINVKAICWVNSNSRTGNVRLYDVTNSKVIATADGFNNISPIIIDLGDVTNLPLTDAIFEFQTTISSASGTVYISSGHLYFY
jgi:hypothetical protein